MTIEIRESVLSDADELARLRWKWRSEGGDEPSIELDEFVDAFSAWWTQRNDYVTLVATVGERIVGMGFLALVDRVPFPSALERRQGDIQSVYISPEHRARGIGSILVEALVDHAKKAGCIRVTVHSSSRAIPVYERAGFEHAPNLMMRSLAD